MGLTEIRKLTKVGRKGHISGIILSPPALVIFKNREFQFKAFFLAVSWHAMNVFTLRTCSL